MSVENLEQYRRKVREMVAREEQERKPKNNDGDGDGGPPLSFVRKCYLTSEVGDSLLFNYLHRGQFVHNVLAKDGLGWMQYVGPHWQPDYNGQAKSAVEAVAACYLPILESIEDEINKGTDDKGAMRALKAQKKACIARLDRLRSDRGRSAVLKCAISNSDPLTVHPDELDQHPWLLPVRNGIVDLRTGEFRAGGDSGLYFTRVAAAEWQGIDAACPTWEKFLKDVLDDPAVIDYLQRVLGYAITGLRSERLFVVFYGPHGHNGKDTLIGAVSHVLGDLAGPIQTELLISQRFSRSPGGPRPEIMALKGLRVAYAAETEKQHSFASGQVKRYSGGNELIGRGLNENYQTTFFPTHLMFLLCNDLPSAPAKDTPFWERIRVFPFLRSFVDVCTRDFHRPVDKTIDIKLEKESSGILAWLVRGCLGWQRRGLDPPEVVLKASRNYREHEDILQHFLDDYCLVDKEDVSTENRTLARKLHDHFVLWFGKDSPGKRPMSYQDFSDQMELKGFPKVKSSNMYFSFVRIDGLKEVTT